MNHYPLAPQHAVLSRDLDFYKLTMGNVIIDKHPDDEVTFTLKNRNSQQPLSEYIPVEALAGRFEQIREQGFTTEEIAYYASLTAQNGDARFSEAYLDHIADIQLPEVSITTNPTTGDLDVSTTGPWVDVSLWETVVMSEINELYYQGLMQHHGLSLDDLYAEGDKRLDEKIEKLANRPDITFCDFGTRRRFSAAWHQHVIERLMSELPDSFVGTSNPWFAHKYGLQPIGTFAHEMPMVYSGIADARGENPLNGQGEVFEDWQQVYDGDLSIALPDTYGSDYFFATFSAEQAAQWNGLRHDSGDPIEFGEHAIAFYEQHDIDPQSKTIVFSDGLNCDAIIRLADHFQARTNVQFGWGTTLMNDLGLPANNFVMKATNVNGVDTVKLSDDKGKHTGPIEKVDYYESQKSRAIGELAIQRAVMV